MNLPKPKFFELAFLNDTTFEYVYTPGKFYVKQYGTIQFQTGKIVLSSFEGVGETLPFVEWFPIGTYPVQLSVGREDYGQDFLVYARVLFSNKPVVKWEYAVRPGERKKQFTDTTFDHCIFSESNYFMYVLGDSISHKKLLAKRNGVTDKQTLNIFQADSFNNYYRVTTFKFERHRLFVFGGEYRGCYAAYIGYDSNGKICRLLIDPGNYSLPLSFF